MPAVVLLAVMLLWSAAASAACPHDDAGISMPVATIVSLAIEAPHCAQDRHQTAVPPCCAGMVCGTMHVGLIGPEPLPHPYVREAAAHPAASRLHEGLGSRPDLPPPRPA